MSEPRQAKTVSLGGCAHGTVHLSMLDAEGQVFAISSMSVETAAAVAQDIVDTCNDILALVQAEAAGATQQ